MTIQQTIIACTAALLLGIYAMSDVAFWKATEPWQVWCEANEIRWFLNDGNCKVAWNAERRRNYLGR
jgi:hypothetical protein